MFAMLISRLQYSNQDCTPSNHPDVTRQIYMLPTRLEEVFKECYVMLDLLSITLIFGLCVLQVINVVAIYKCKISLLHLPYQPLWRIDEEMLL